MYRFKAENLNCLKSHNIRISQLNPSNMSTPPARKVIRLPKVRMLSRARQPTGTSAGHSPASTGIRITNVKSIRPPDPEIIKKQEEDKLRAQLQKEIVSRSRTCAYSRYPCPLGVVSGRAYCARHVLSDPAAPYARCSIERCHMPARPHPDPHSQLCFEHARAALYARQRAAAPPPPVTTTETLLNQLQHYIKPERTRTTSCASSVSVVSDPADTEILPQSVDPFKQIDAVAVNAAYSASIMECASASDSDADSVAISGAEPGNDGADPEDAPPEDMPLWRAGVFTCEEAVRCALSTLRALQAAYRAQCAALHRDLRAVRHRYLRALKQEKETYCSIYSQAVGGASVRERRQLRKLRAYAGYRRRHTAHAVLARKLHNRRAKLNETSTKPVPAGARCTFAEGGVRCPHHSLPAAKHCLKHIVHDTHQVLFAACGCWLGGVSCREPVARLPLPAAACRYHTHPPTYTVFTLKKDESDSDADSITTVDSQRTHCEDPPALPAAALPSAGQ